MDNTNPYASPKRVAESIAPRRTRWRVIPSALLILLGGALALSSVAFLVLALVTAWLGRAVSVEAIFGGLLHGVGGLVWVLSGIAIWKRMWWWGAIGAIAGYFIGALGAFYVS